MTGMWMTNLGPHLVLVRFIVCYTAAGVPHAFASLVTYTG
jgi:hypothetical protein